MGVTRSRFVVWVCLFVVVGTSAGSLWRLRAQGGGGTVGQAAQTLKERRKPAPVTAGDRGATYHTLEREAVHVKTAFRDAVIEADRAPDGRLSSRVLDLAGNELGTMRVQPVDGSNDTLEFSTADGASLRAVRPQNLRPTLDWASTQAYSFWNDRRALPATASFEWQDTLMRPKGASRRDVGTEVLKIDTEFKNGLSATVTRKTATHISYITNQQTTGVVFQSVFRKDGVEVGISQWWPAEQTFAWSFPGLTADGYVTPERLRDYGGWTFTPDMAWLNIQSLAMQEFGTLLKEKGTLAKKSGNWFERLAQFVIPTAQANEPGCDTLHWLDGTILRWCCDVHDYCYQAYSCTASSWWVWNWWNSWQCDYCNVGAVYCFSTAGGHLLYRAP